MKNTAAIEAWVVKTLGSRLVRMAGDEALAAELAGANEEVMWRIRHYDYQKAETLGRSLPGFDGRTPQGANDRYSEALAAFRRLKADGGDRPSFVVTLLCGLRYHPQMEEVVDMIHDYATKGGCTPDWREVTPAEADFASPAYPARLGWMPVWVRATGHRSTRRVWRVYLDQKCRHHAGDLQMLQGARETAFTPYHEPLPEPRWGWTARGSYLVVRGKWCELYSRRLPESEPEPETASEDAPAAEWEVELLNPPVVATEG